MQNPHSKSHSKPKNPFKELLSALERTYALPCGFHYVSHESHPGARTTDPGTPKP